MNKYSSEGKNIRSVHGAVSKTGNQYRHKERRTSLTVDRCQPWDVIHWDPVSIKGMEIG